MAYIGKSIESGTFKVLDTSGNTYNGSNTTFSLGTQVGSAAQLLVSHDGVIQLPGTDYTLASGGASITFSTAPASGASIFIVEISGAVGGTVTPSDTSVTADKLNTALLTGHTDIGAGIADADLFLVDDGAGGTLRKTAASRIKTYVGGFDVSSITGATALAEQPAATDELVLSDAGTLKRLDFSHLFATPAFEATVSSSYNISDATAEKVSFNTEVFDTDGKYDHSTNYRFTPTVAGKYFCYLYVQQSGESNQDFEQGYAYIYKNGSSHAQVHTSSYSGNAIRDITLNVYAVIDLDADDYIEAYSFYDDNEMSSNPRVVGGSTNTRFGAYRLLT